MSEQGYIVFYFLASGFGVFSLYYLARMFMAISKESTIVRSLRFSREQRDKFVTIFFFSFVLGMIWLLFIEKYFFYSLGFRECLLMLAFPVISAYIHKILDRP